MIGGIEPARELNLTALKNGKPVVTANKELLANVGTEISAWPMPLAVICCSRQRWLEAFR